MKAVVLREVGRPTAVEELALRAVGKHEVRVRLVASGVCHSDLSLRDGTIPPMLPCTLGHEGAGIVTEVGGDVARVKPGDHVVLSWLVSCRSCPHCLRGEPQLCVHAYDHAYGGPYADAGGPVWPGMGVGALAEETLLPGAAGVAVDEALPVRPGESVLVIGCGGVGLAAIQGARLAGASPIIAADRVAAQLPAALANGATDAVDASAGDLGTAGGGLTR